VQSQFRGTVASGLLSFLQQLAQIPSLVIRVSAADPFAGCLRPQAEGQELQALACVQFSVLAPFTSMEKMSAGGPLPKTSDFANSCQNALAQPLPDPRKSNCVILRSLKTPTAI